MLIGSGRKLGQECAHSALLNHPLGFVGRGKIAAQLLWPGMEARLRKSNGQLDIPSTETADDDGTYLDRDSWIRKVILNRQRFGRDGLTEEEGRTNLAYPSEDFGDARWVASSGVIDSTSRTLPDKATNTTNELRATGANATFIQDLGVIASAAKVFSVYLKRVTGTGNIDITLDGGATWTTVAINSSTWTRVEATQTLADPDVGVRIVTSGDEVAAFGAQLEDVVSLASSYIPTTSVAVTRAGGNIQHSTPASLEGLTTSWTLIMAVTPRSDLVSASFFASIPDGTHYIWMSIDAAGKWAYSMRSASGGQTATSTTSAAVSRTDILGFTMQTVAGQNKLYVNSVEEDVVPAYANIDVWGPVMYVGKYWSGQWLSGNLARLVLVNGPELSVRQVENVTAVTRKAA